MHSGILWFDNSKEDPFVKIAKGIKHYFKKFGRKPDLVLVHPSYVKSEETSIEAETTFSLENGEEVTVKYTLRFYRPVLPGHIWIGIEDRPASVQPG